MPVVPSASLEMLPHPVRLRTLVPVFTDFKQALGAEWDRLQALLKNDTYVLPEVIRRLGLPGVAPTFSRLVLATTAMPGGTDAGGALGMVAFLRQQASPAPHFILDDALVDMLEHTDIAPDVPMSMFNLPFKRLYIELGRNRKLQTTIPNVMSGDHQLEGAYIEAGQHEEGEILYIVLTGSPLGKSGPHDDATLALALPLHQPDRSIAEIVQSAQDRARTESSQYGFTTTPLDWTDATIRAVLLLVKALLYIGLPGTRREMHPEHSDALKSIAGLKSPGKRAKAMRRMERVYDYIRIDAQPDHRQTPAPSTGERSVKSHWRRGHYRLQAHGTQMSLRKLIFIQPVLVAPGPGEHQAAAAEYRVS